MGLFGFQETGFYRLLWLIGCAQDNDQQQAYITVSNVNPRLPSVTRFWNGWRDTSLRPLFAHMLTDLAPMLEASVLDRERSPIRPQSQGPWIQYTSPPLVSTLTTSLVREYSTDLSCRGVSTSASLHSRLTSWTG